MAELKKDGIRAAMSDGIERETLKGMAQRGTTEPQSTTEPQLEPCRCGRKALIERFHDGDDPQPLFVATCEVCPVKTYDQFSAEEAARIWNTFASAPSVKPVVNILGEQWQHVQIKAGNPRVVAISFETPDQATSFINSFAASSPAPTVAPELDDDRVEEIKRWRERFTGYHADHAVALRRAFGYIDYLLERLAPASTVAPVEQPKAHYENAHDARYSMTHPVHPDIVVLWFLALKSHWFDDPNNMFYGQREAAKAYLYKWVETGEIADDNTTLEIATAMKFREWLSSSWTTAAPLAETEDEAT